MSRCSLPAWCSAIDTLGQLRKRVAQPLLIKMEAGGRARRRGLGRAADASLDHHRRVGVPAISRRFGTFFHIAEEVAALHQLHGEEPAVFDRERARTG